MFSEKTYIHSNLFHNIIMLYIIPTPIWNRDDITIRWKKLLQDLKYLICEDTRTTMKLLSMYEIDYKDKEFYSLTSFTDQWKLKHYVNILQANDVWLVSEAGTPWLSDPWKTLIRLCNENNINYSILPGANALVPAVVGSGFDTSKFVYLGFFPQKKWRQTLLKNIIEKKYGDSPVFFYESVHRIEKLIKELKELDFQWQISISRELSKKFEQHITWNLQEIESMIKNKFLTIKWEFVVGLF